MKTEIEFTNDFVLEDDRVLLRPLAMADFVNLVRFSVEQPELWKYSLSSAAGPGNLQQYIQQACDNRSRQKEYPFIVYDKATAQYAGCTRFYDIQPAQQSLQLGYTWYGREFQGTGLNKHCKYLLLQLAFEQWEMERVEFRADNDNKRSIAAMLGIGCTVEGVLRSHMQRPDGSRRDSIVLSILKPEWEGKIKDQLRHSFALR